MTDYKHLKADYENFAEKTRQQGLLASVAKYGLIGGGLAGAVIANYLHPGFVDAVAQITEADMAHLSAPARAIYAENMVSSMDNFSADVLGAIDAIVSPIKTNIEHYKNGTLVEANKEWLAEQEIFGMELGGAVVSAFDWALKTDPSAETFIGRSPYAKPVVGIGAATLMVAIACKAAFGATAKALEATAKTFSQATNVVSNAKELASGLFKKMRAGIELGIDAALGCGRPNIVTNPFADPEPEAQAVPLEHSLFEKLKAAGVEDDVARSIADEIGDRISQKDDKIEELSIKAVRFEEQIAQVHQVIYALSTKVDTMVHPDDVDRVVRRALADGSDRSPRTPSDTPTLH